MQSSTPRVHDNSVCVLYVKRENYGHTEAAQLLSTTTRIAVITFDAGFSKESLARCEGPGHRLGHRRQGVTAVGAPYFRQR